MILGREGVVRLFWMGQLGLGLLALHACARDVLIGANQAPSEQDASHAGAPGQQDRDSRACVSASCQGHIYLCGNCVDDDEDGLVDMDDPDCLGPCHHSESIFFGSIPGQNRAPCKADCYFDQDTGGGNDACIWSHTCDPLSVGPSFFPEGPGCAYAPSEPLARQTDCATAMSSQLAECRDACEPLTPNGCDCFGCCSIPGASTPVWLGSTDEAGNGTCDLAHVADPSRCRPCTQVPSCINPCETCELCVGKRSLPPGCAIRDCTPPLCPSGRAPCGLDCLPACTDGKTCITGCCTDVPR